LEELLLDRGEVLLLLPQHVVIHAQVQAVAPLTGITPARNLPASLRKASDKLEFFEAKGGQVFYRRKVLADSGQKPGVVTSVKKDGQQDGECGECLWPAGRCSVSDTCVSSLISDHCVMIRSRGEDSWLREGSTGAQESQQDVTTQKSRYAG